MQGKGKLVFKDGSKFKSGSYLEGIFENGQILNGEFFSSETNQYIKANFIEGKAEGKATITLNGKTTQVVFKNGEIQN